MFKLTGVAASGNVLDRLLIHLQALSMAAMRRLVCSLRNPVVSIASLPIISNFSWDNVSGFLLRRGLAHHVTTRAIAWVYRQVIQLGSTWIPERFSMSRDNINLILMVGVTKSRRRNNKFIDRQFWVQDVRNCERYCKTVWYARNYEKNRCLWEISVWCEKQKAGMPLRMTRFDQGPQPEDCRL